MFKVEAREDLVVEGEKLIEKGDKLEMTIAVKTRDGKQIELGPRTLSSLFETPNFEVY